MHVRAASAGDRPVAKFVKRPSSDNPQPGFKNFSLDTQDLKEEIQETGLSHQYQYDETGGSIMPTSLRSKTVVMGTIKGRGHTQPPLQRDWLLIDKANDDREQILFF